MPTFKSTQMTNVGAGPPATVLKSSEHNRVHVDYHAYTPVGTETTGDIIELGFLPIDAKILPQSYIQYDATAAWCTFGDAGDASRMKTRTDISSAGSFKLDELGNLDWEVDSAGNQTLFMTVSGTMTVDKDIFVALCYTY